MAAVRKYTRVTKLTAKMLNELIDKIVVYQLTPNETDIIFTAMNEYCIKEYGKSMQILNEYITLYFIKIFEWQMLYSCLFVYHKMI